jgi:NAD(P)H-hydrate epimerase
MFKKGYLKNLITSQEIQSVEFNAKYFGISRIQLMENAGHEVALEIVSRFEPKESVAIFCGLGGNGGDGFVAARHLASRGFKVIVFLAGKAKEIVNEAALKNFKALQSLKEIVSIHEVSDSSLIPKKITAHIVVDALLGVGVKGELKPPILQLVKKINKIDSFVIAVDIPTGIDADNGEVLGEAVKADLTITFYKAKRGFEDAKAYIGELIVKDIGLPKLFEQYVGPGDVLRVSKKRKPQSRKGDFGRLLVIGGSEIYSGAPALVALAALRTGVDLVYVATSKKNAHTISSISPNLITIKLKGEHLNIENISSLKCWIKKVDAVVLGPGINYNLEITETVKEIVKIIESSGIPLLLDADGIKAFSKFKRVLKIPLLLTPHSGEYKILTKRTAPENLRDRGLEVKRTAKKLDATVLLKGFVDIISNSEQVKFNFTGNPGMTVGGTGDVLSGIIGAFLAQKIEPFKAAVAGSFVNGASGDFAFKKRGYHLVATDLIDWIPYVLDNPLGHMKVRKIDAEKN